MTGRDVHLLGYTCEPHNNPPDFFLDVINGDSSAVMLSSKNGEQVAFQSSGQVEASCEVRFITTTSSSPPPLPLPSEANDLDAVSASRQRIEDKLVEEYRNCEYYRQTKAELGTSRRTTSRSGVGLNLIVESD